VTGTILLWAAGGLVLLVWASRHLTISRIGSTQDTLRPDGSLPLPDDAPKVSVVVPAKDEEANIGQCLATLLAQDYPDFEIIVVDDRSRDGTADAVRRAAAADARVRLVQVQALPDGWFGKTHAMHVGAAQAAGQWLLFVDADCRQATGSLRAAMSYTLARGGDMLSLWPLLEMHSFAENLLQPLLGSILGLYFRPQWVNDPRRRAAFANGQFILIRRNAYEAVGGHAAVRSALVEDIALARAVKGAGHRLLNAMGFDLFRTRMYDRFSGIWRGWTRIFSAAFRSPWTLLPVMLLVTLFSLSPYVLTAVAGTMAWRAEWTDARLNALAALGLVQLILMLSVLVRYNRMVRARPIYLALYPISALLVLGILADALLAGLGLKTVRWRGTTYRKGRRVE